MDNQDFQIVYNILGNVLPVDWKKVAFCAEYTEGSYSMKYYVDLGNGEYIDCYNLEGISRKSVIRTFININKQLSKIRESLPKEKRWNVITLLIDNSGKFKAEYDYDDISENVIKYHENWEKKYLHM